MVSAGRVMLIPKGEYNALTTYNVLDMVSYNGSSYVAKTTTTGNRPTDTSKWMIMASSGAGQTFENLSDVDFSNLAEGDLPIYDSINNEWKNTSTSAVTVTNNPISITTQSAQVARDTKITLAPIQASGTPTPSNPSPISGYDSVDLQACGVNQWDEEWELGGISDSGQNYASSGMIRTKNYILVDASKTYYINTGAWGSIRCYDQNKNFIGNAHYTSDSPGYLLSLLPNTKYIRTNFNPQYGTTYNHDISINYPPTDKAYHAYEGERIVNQLPSTVYGGELDVETGVLKGTYVSINLDTHAANYNGGRWIYSINDALAAWVANNQIANIKAACYVPDTAFHVYAGQTLNTIAIEDGNMVTVYNGSDSIKPTGIAVYELKTPYEIPLTPRLVNLLQGANVITSNGTSVTLTYREGTIATLEDIPSETVNKLSDMVADVQGDISTLDSTKTDLSAIAPIEDGTTASQAYKVNEYFIRGGKLCKCISAISAGSAFTLNTNYKETTLANEIPKYTVSTTDITAGTTPLASGQFYIYRS